MSLLRHQLRNRPMSVRVNLTTVIPASSSFCRFLCRHGRFRIFRLGSQRQSVGNHCDPPRHPVPWTDVFPGSPDHPYFAKAPLQWIRAESSCLRSRREFLDSLGFRLGGNDRPGGGTGTEWNQGRVLCFTNA